MKNKLYTLFRIKIDKINKNGLAPIYFRITMDGKRLELSTQQYVDPIKWNADAGRLKGFSGESLKVNGVLDAFRSKVETIIQELSEQSEELKLEDIKEKLLGTKQRVRSIIDIFKDHNNRVESLIDQDFAKGTYIRYVTTLKHLQNFLKWKFNAIDYNIEDIGLAFINDFEYYLRSVRKCANNSAVKYIRNFGKIIRICLSYDWIDKDPFINYKSKVKVVDRTFLSEEELERIWVKDFTNERLNQVKDIFVFSCYTGLAYVDVQILTQQHIVLGIDGDKWIHTNRQKTDSKSHIPLLPIPLEIISKYSDHPVCVNRNKLLPVLSNQKTNAYLKEIANICGIDKLLTFHIARHTFATTVTLTNGVPIETVSSMLGHSSLKTTQHYAKILDKKVSMDMKVLKEKFADKSNLQINFEANK
ncbi:MAG: site-specific integrase [Saprospiraceae bacterium]